MKNKVKKIWFLCFMLILVWSMSGCDDGKKNEKDERTELEESIELEETLPTEEPVKETPAVTTEPEIIPTPAPTVTSEPKVTTTPEPEITPEPIVIPKPVVTPTPEPQEPLPPKAIEYGDRITVSYDKTVYKTKIWKYAGSQEFKVSTESKQFQSKSEESTMENVEQSIGKTAGETFTIWVEEDDGLHGYEYTIVEVKGKNADKIEYGDRIFTSYVMRGTGVDTGDGVTIYTGEQMLHLVNNDEFMARIEGGWSADVADYRIRDLLEKGIDHSFDMVQESYEWSHHYKYRIHGISKAIKYGDIIKTEVREVVLVPDESLSMADGETTFDFMVNSTELDPNEIEDKRAVFHELMGKTVGDNVEFSLFGDDDFYVGAEIYNMEILSVKPAAMQEADIETEGMRALMLADKEEIVYIKESAPYNGYVNGGWSPEDLYIIAKDTENDMIYEFSGYYVDTLYLAFVKGEKREFDSEGRVIKEIKKKYYESDGWDMYCDIIDYKYDATGNCVECVESVCYPGEEGKIRVYCITTYQYDEQGVCTEEKNDHVGRDDGLIEYIYYNEMHQMIKKVSTYSDGRRYVSEYDSTKPHYYCKTTYYDAEGNVTVSEEDYEEDYEYDEWGFIVPPYYD